MPEYIVSQGILGETKTGPWMVFEKKPNGSLRRVRSFRLPARETKEEAERDMREWLKKGGSQSQS